MSNQMGIEPQFNQTILNFKLMTQESMTILNFGYSNSDFESSLHFKPDSIQLGQAVTPPVILGKIK